jgi:hypothetical protein
LIKFSGIPHNPNPKNNDFEPQKKNRKVSHLQQVVSHRLEYLEQSLENHYKSSSDLSLSIDFVQDTKNRANFLTIFTDFRHTEFKVVRIKEDVSRVNII